MNSKEVRDIFDNTQHLHKHQKCMKQMKELYENYCKSEEDLLKFKEELRRDILYTLNLEPKSPFTKHTIEFIANFLRSFSAKKEVPKETDDTDGDTTIIDEEMVAEEETNNRSDQENRCPDDEECDELGMESFGSESFSRSKSETNLVDSSTAKNTDSEEEPTFADVVIKEQLIRFLMNKKSHIRLNCCLLIRKLFADLEDMDLDVYQILKKSLLDRLRDKDKFVRSAAALALHRFQEVDEPKDLVTVALKYHLNYDPDYRVRQSCLLSIQASIHTINEFISSTRDVKDINRKTAFTTIADKFDVKNFGIESRLQILRNGLNERHSAVKKVVETKVIPNWIKSYGGDLVQLLYGLDIQSEPLLIERMLFLYFDHINKDLDESSDSTGFHHFLDEFKERFLEDNKLLTKEELTVENAFLWRIVAKYCKDKDITISAISEDVEEADHQMLETDSQPVKQTKYETVDAIDTIVPDLPHYCRYLTVFVRQLLANDFDLHQMMEFEFMFNQLLLMGELIEIGDEMQRQILRKCVIDLLENKELFNRIHNYISLLMKLFAKNSDLNMLLETTLTTIDGINSESIETELPTTTITLSQPVPSVEVNVKSIDEQLRQYELDYAKLSVRVEALKDDLESAKRDGNELEAQKVEELITSLKTRMDDVIDKRLRINDCQPSQPSQQSSQQSTHNEIKTQKTLTDDPIALERCLQIFCGCLEFGDFKSTNSVILTLIERLVMPSIPSVENRIRALAFKTLGLVCLLSPDFAKKNFLLFVQVLNLDSEEAQETALKCIFDILCFHGLTHFDQKSNERRKSRKSIANSSFKESNKTLINNTENDENIEDFDKTIINFEGNEILCSDSDQESDEDEDSFISLFTDLLEKNLNSESDPIKLIAAEGIAKLFLLGRMYSPQLLSKLLILWYDTDSTEEMRQFLGSFLPIYSTVQMKANLKGENAFEECFVKTVETVFDGSLTYINLDNVINFILELISDDGHRNLAKSVANQILSRMGINGVDDTLSIKYYLRVLSMVRLTEMSSHDIKEYKILVKKIERKLNQLKNKTKLTLNRLQTIKTKIEKQVELIKENATNFSTIEDFGSLSLSHNMSQTLSERSHIDETVIEEMDSQKD